MRTVYQLTCTMNDEPGKRLPVVRELHVCNSSRSSLQLRDDGLQLTLSCADALGIRHCKGISALSDKKILSSLLASHHICGLRKFCLIFAKRDTRGANSEASRNPDGWRASGHPAGHVNLGMLPDTNKRYLVLPFRPCSYFIVHTIHSIPPICTILP